LISEMGMRQARQGEGSGQPHSPYETVPLPCLVNCGTSLACLVTCVSPTQLASLASWWGKQGEWWVPHHLSCIAVLPANHPINHPANHLANHPAYCSAWPSCKPSCKSSYILSCMFVLHIVLHGCPANHPANHPSWLSCMTVLHGCPTWPSFIVVLQGRPANCSENCLA